MGCDVIVCAADSFRYSCDICGKKYKYYSCFQEHRDLHAVDGNELTYLPSLLLLLLSIILFLLGLSIRCLFFNSNGNLFCLSGNVDLTCSSIKVCGFVRMNSWEVEHVKSLVKGRAQMLKTGN